MYEYIPPVLTVDAVTLALVDGRLSALVHRRPNEPFKNSWALPGAFCSRDVSLEEALSQRVLSKLDIRFNKLPYFEQLYTFDTAQRDPRGPAISVAYLGITRKGDYELAAGDAMQSRFFAVSDLPELAFDHTDIIKLAVDRLRSKLLYTDIVKYALPAQFTLTQLQEAYEQISSQEFDKRNFRKRFLGLDVIEPTADKLVGTAHRPAQLYQFTQATLQEFTRAFS